jgi:glycosyltransferase involved in cell wall biosynthesis
MKILAFPRGLENPYQELLYGAMRAEGDRVRYLSLPTPSATVNLPTIIPQLILWRMRGYRIFHLHWANAFSLQAKFWRTRALRQLPYWHYLLCLKTIKLLGYKFIWTAHNALPHEQTFPDDIQARRALVAATDLVILHTTSTLSALEKLGALPKKYIIIPHGSYIGVYPNTMNRETARKKLGLASDAFIYLYLGQIRGYKGIENLMDAYRRIKTEKNHLIVAGKGSPTGFISDNDLQIYFNAADVVVLPFKQVTTSGSVLLALSFGKAVIIPALGDLASLPVELSYPYPPEDQNGLVRAMQLAEADKEILQRKNTAAQAYANRLSWPIIGKKTHEAIQNLLANHGAASNLTPHK